MDAVAHLRRALLGLVLLGAGCSRDGVPAAVDGAAEDMALAPIAIDASGWPRRITLQGNIADPTDQLRLADGAVVPAGGDLRLVLGRIIALWSPTKDGVCQKGGYPSLEAIPADTGSCPSSLSMGWEAGAQVSATFQHTAEESTSLGTSMLVRDAGKTALYRLRILSDSYDKMTFIGTITFDYQPVF